MARKGKKRNHQQYEDEESYQSSYVDDSAPSMVEDLPQVKRYEHPGQLREDLRRYFHQRYRIFGLYDHGIWMTENSWFEATQEAVARKIATHVHNGVNAASRPEPHRSVVMDIMAGVGGNTIAFAQQDNWVRVYGFEKDPAALECAKNNATVYGVHDKITWFSGDCFEEIASNVGLQVILKDFGIAFCSPPWGGPEYRNDEVFNLDTMEPYSLRKIVTELRKYTDHIVMYLPRTSDLRQIAELVEDGRKVHVIHYCTDASSRALCVYFGPFDLTL